MQLLIYKTQFVAQTGKLNYVVVIYYNTSNCCILKSRTAVDVTNISIPGKKLEGYSQFSSSILEGETIQLC